MESVIYHLHAGELDKRFVKSIKSLFRGQNLKLTISPEAQETANPDVLEKLRMSEESATSYILPSSDWDKLMLQVEEDTPADEIIRFVQSYRVNK